jgi:hypothetical protein
MPHLVELMKNLEFATFGAVNKAVLIGSLDRSATGALAAANIAIAYAQTGRTLLIDGSMRAQGLHHYFHRTPQPGLSDVLIGHTPLEEALQVIHPDLAFLPGGTPTSYGAKLLQRPFFAEIVKALSQSFAHVVLYYPDLREAQAESEIVRTAGSVILVLRAGTPLERIRRFLGAYQTLPNVKGLILDQLR